MIRDENLKFEILGGRRHGGGVHIPDGYLDPRTAAGTFCLAGVGLTWAARRARAQFREATLPLMGLMSAFVFASQLVNFPILGGTSGHMLGAALATLFLGPWGAMLVMSTVLFVQCLFFQDGGVTALGANLLNLAVLAPWTAFGVLRLLGGISRDRRWQKFTMGAAGFCSILVASTACCLELAASDTARLGTVLPAMTFLHALIGLVEGILTASLAAFVIRLRPDLLAVREAGHGVELTTWGGSVGTWLAGLVGLALLLAPLASKDPDALEAVGHRMSLTEAAVVSHSPFSGYAIPGVNGAMGSAMTGAFGTCVAFGVAWLLLRRLGRR